MTDRETISYEQARDELASVVRRLEAGGLTLEQSLELWERGEKLAAICAEWLDGARARLTAAMAAREAEDAKAKDAAVKAAEGNPGEAPF
ncbi:MAG TPA: exodeoxyribonuclease VII small subunit [Trebonia sp.]|nr:exodeoxyribonuclease VII small subunit [Trebonia sp.]